MSSLSIFEFYILQNELFLLCVAYLNLFRVSCYINRSILNLLLKDISLSLLLPILRAFIFLFMFYISRGIFAFVLNVAYLLKLRFEFGDDLSSSFLRLGTILCQMIVFTIKSIHWNLDL